MNLKQIVFILLSVFSLTAVGQTKKVAVWETKCSDNSLRPIQKTMVRGGMETSVGNTPGYEVFDRSAFDVIMKEHHFERSGAVSEAEIKELGKIAGVQYIIVPEAMTDGTDFYIIVKMLDVETGKFGGVHQALCTPTGSDIYKACEKLGAELFGSSYGVSNSNGNRSNGNATTQRGQDFTETAFGINMKMIYVEGGTFTMGCTGEQGSDCYDGEKPVHMVTLSNYYIGETEVTVRQFMKFITETGYRTDAEKDGGAWRWIKVGDEWKWNYVNGLNWMYDANGNVRNSSEYDHPVLYVSWNDANEFCKWLRQKTGKSYRLPTEAEWEYAARGGRRSKGYKFSGSNSINDVAWYGNLNSSTTANGKTHSVGTKTANELGIYDMSGNVWEWCQDWYGSYSSASQTDPMGPAAGSYRVLRGGSWICIAGDCRVSYRNRTNPGNRIDCYGFRVVLH